MRQLKITKQVTNRETASLDKYLQEIGRVELLTADDEVELARKIIAETSSCSKVGLVPYEDVFGDGFEDMQRRVPSIAKAERLLGWQPQRSLSDIIRDVALSQPQT